MFCQVFNLMSSEATGHLGNLNNSHTFNCYLQVHNSKIYTSNLELSLELVTFSPGISNRYLRLTMSRRRFLLSPTVSLPESSPSLKVQTHSCHVVLKPKTFGSSCPPPYTHPNDQQNLWTLFFKCIQDSTLLTTCISFTVPQNIIIWGIDYSIKLLTSSPLSSIIYLKLREIN